MWIFLSDAFLSIVADNRDPDRLMVRARAPGDIERFLSGHGLSTLPAIVETPDADYRFRVSAPRDVVNRALSERLQGISYPNFKNSVRERDRHLAYQETWDAMRLFQERRRRKKR